MYTFQDFMSASNKIEEVRNVIRRHTSSAEYVQARTAENYYLRRNDTIIQLQRMLYTVSGKMIPDTFSSDYRLRSNWLNYFIAQLNQYLLSNGVAWAREDTKKKLGKGFDTALKRASRYALTHGQAFGFWNLDRLEPYSFLEFAPLYDEDNGALRAGVRFWQLGSNKPLRARLFEEDGYTDIIWKTRSEDGEIIGGKSAYIKVVRGTVADGVEIYDGANYPAFPVVPLFGIEKQSELEGRRELIDCFDMIASGFANTVEEASYVYWALQNAEGMTDVDLAKFVEKMKTIHAAMVKGNNGAHAEPHAIEAPYASRKELLNELREELFYSFKAFDAKQIQSRGAVIAQIDAAYEMLDQKASEYEDNIFEFIDRLLPVVGIDDVPYLKRSKIPNRSEEIANLIQSAEYLTPDYITKAILTIFGDGDLADSIIKERDAEDMERVTIGNRESTGETNEQ